MLKKYSKFIGSAIKKLKDPYWRARCKYIKYYEELPICDNYILLQAYLAKKIDGNIFYILKYLTSNSRYANYKIYLAVMGRYRKGIQKKLEYSGISNVNIVTYSSDEHVRLLASAKYLFTDFELPRFFIKKAGQIYTNTWHGTPLKTLGYAKTENKHILGNLQRNFVMSDYLLYPNEFTKSVMLRDFMLENLSDNSYILGGYPRNEIFFDDASREYVRSEMQLNEKRVYAYLPTWREKISKDIDIINDAYLSFYLWEIDDRLTDDEIMYVNIHPLARNAAASLKRGDFKHIRSFPDEYETYVFLNIADVLVTDYSSVFFDFACTRRKIVLFPYDKEEYLIQRGMYFSIDELPFPQVFDAESLVKEIRSDKKYDDSEFLRKYNGFDNPLASQRLCDFVVFGENKGLEVKKIPDNKKENVLIYGGSLKENGITSSLRALLNNVDLSKRNYYITFREDYVKKNSKQLDTFNDNVNFFAHAPFHNLTVYDHVIFKLFQKGFIHANYYMKKCGKRLEEEFIRAYGNARFDTIIHFSGYGTEPILLYSASNRKNIIFAMKDMVSAAKAKKIRERTDVLQYAYKHYSKVAAADEKIISSISEISKRNNILTVHNQIDHKPILKRRDLAEIDEFAALSPDEANFENIMRSFALKFVNIGIPFSEKGYDNLLKAFDRLISEGKTAYLIIMCENSPNGAYENLRRQIDGMGAKNHIIPILGALNSYSLFKACDYIIMSSYYVGMPAAFFKSDIYNDLISYSGVKRPKAFTLKKSGTLAEDSEYGIYQCLNKLYNLTAEYEQHNNQCLEEFEKIFES